MEPYVAFFDIETQSKISDMPGNTREEQVTYLQMSVACVITIPVRLCLNPGDAEKAVASASEHAFWRETTGHLDSMLELLSGAKAVVGYNLIGFDYLVVKKYAVGTTLLDLASKTLDVFSRVRDATGVWYKLDRLLQLNGMETKSANGLEAIAMYERGEYERLQNYCMADVRLTARLSLLGSMRVNRSYSLGPHVFAVSAFLRSMGVACAASPAPEPTGATAP